MVDPRGSTPPGVEKIRHRVHDVLDLTIRHRRMDGKAQHPPRDVFGDGKIASCVIQIPVSGLQVQWRRVVDRRLHVPVCQMAYQMIPIVDEDRVRAVGVRGGVRGCAGNRNLERSKPLAVLCRNGPPAGEGVRKHGQLDAERRRLELNEPRVESFVPEQGARFTPTRFLPAVALRARPFATRETCKC